MSPLPGHSQRSMTTAPRHASRPNRLIREKSPYLLQHAYNPVDWYPWGPEAIETARREHKPIFLSIGYSTCHWCHVMERESFEDPAIARWLNQSFVPIKVDREEHPDVDHLYMNAVTLLTGQGGWPLNVFLTPELKPFFGGTYFPPTPRWNLPGMNELLPAVAEAWKSRREELLTSAEHLTTSLSASALSGTAVAPVTLELLEAAVRHAAGAFDAERGGFGEAPKFPRSHELSFLLTYGSRTGSAQALAMVRTTLDQMARGGIHDQIGGGFHRYSTDARWLVPHFEKMLYDQALLARTYAESYRMTKDPEDAMVARDILEYVLQELRDPLGGFYSAEDADSEGVEGKFYVWTEQEILDVVGPAEGALVNAYYGVTAEGNFSDPAHGAESAQGANILHVRESLEAFAARHGLKADEWARRLAAARQRLLEARARRVRPHRDDKILTSWNGLMIASFAYGASTLNEPRYAAAARSAAEFILAHLVRDGTVLRRYRDGEAAYPGTLEDYAFFSYGLLELYEADFDPRWLADAKRLAERMIDRFWDSERGGCFLRGNDEPPLIVRTKEINDGATPSGNSIAALVLLKVGRLTADERLEGYGRRMLETAAPSLSRAAFGSPQMLIAADFALGPTSEVVIAGDPSSPKCAAMVRTLHEEFLPRAVSVLHPDGPSGAAIERLAPYVAAQPSHGGQPTAYVCRGFACQLPTTDLVVFRQWLERTRSDG